MENNPLTSDKFLNTEKIQEIPSSQIYSGNEDSDEILLKHKLIGNSTPLTQSKIDWTPFLNPPKNQFYCGSCWAFASIAAVETNYSIKFGSSPSFSQQQLVDCDILNGGCRGGWPTNALYYIKQNGIAYDNAYPYTSGKISVAGTCSASTKTMNKVVEDYSECPKNNCSLTQHRSLLSQGSIVVSIDGDGNSNGSSIFQHYTGGILDMPCSYANHAVILVGVDSDSTGEFYTGRNSYGSAWGEKGNFRFRVRSSDKTCFMENWAVLPKVKQTFNPIPPPPTPPSFKFYSECDKKGQVTEIFENNPKLNSLPAAGYDIGKFSDIFMYYESQNCVGKKFSARNYSWTCFQRDSLSYLINNIKSIVIELPQPPTGCVWLFDDYCLIGNKVEVCEDVADLDAAPYSFGKQTSSYISGPGVLKVTSYYEKNFNVYLLSQKTIHGLYGMDVDKNIQSIKISK